MRTPRDIAAAKFAGADYVGLVIAPKSPRCLSREEARRLAILARPAMRVVVVAQWAEFDAQQALIAAIKPAILQLHGLGSDGAIAQADRFTRSQKMQLWVACGIANPTDAQRALTIGQHHFVLCDTPASADAHYLGGWGAGFDHSLLEPLINQKPRFGLAGGLDARNVGQAIRTTRPALVDVSSGVEKYRGRKDPHLMLSFTRAVREAWSKPV